jgi:hypothetical protein
MNLISLLTTLIALVFAGAVFERYRERGGNHLLFWSLGAFLYGVGALAETILSVGFSPFALRAWYLAGAMLTAPWLGQGTVALLVRRRPVAPVLSAILLAVSLFAFELIRTAQFDPLAGASYEISLPASDQYRAILERNGVVVALTILLNIYGTVALAGGAIYSAYLFWRKRVLAHRMYGNVLIAVGALLPASGGTSVAFGFVDWHSLSLLLGVIFLYAGYLQAARPKE